MMPNDLDDMVALAHLFGVEGKDAIEHDVGDLPERAMAIIAPHLPELSQGAMQFAANALPTTDVEPWKSLATRVSAVIGAQLGRFVNWVFFVGYRAAMRDQQGESE